MLWVTQAEEFLAQQQQVCPGGCKDLILGSDFLQENGWNVNERTGGSNICVKLPLRVQNEVRGKKTWVYAQSRHILACNSEEFRNS